MSDNVFRIENFEVKHESEAALLVEIEGDEYWIPKSQIADVSEVWSMDTAGDGDLIITRWIAEKKNLL